MDIVKCKYCGKVLKSIQSINMKCGPECLKKHYKTKSLLGWYDETIAKENIKMTKEEIIELMNRRGFSVVSEIDYDAMKILEFQPLVSLFYSDEHKALPAVDVKLVEGKADFRVKFTVLGVIRMSVGWCESLTDDAHFMKQYSALQDAATQLLKWEREA